MDFLIHTLRGERDISIDDIKPYLQTISTHTLRGERDYARYSCSNQTEQFQLTRSVGSVTSEKNNFNATAFISTHTLRGERDNVVIQWNGLICLFQLTRSVGSVTLHIVYAKSHHHNRADILLKIT